MNAKKTLIIQLILIWATVITAILIIAIKQKTMQKFNIEKFNPCGEWLEYYESKPSFEEAWNDCHRGDWMLWIASKLKVDNRTLTRAKALCANTVRHLMMDKRSTDAIDAALRYADGKISREELNVYTRAADAAILAAILAAVFSDEAAHAAHAALAAFAAHSVLPAYFDVDVDAASMAARAASYAARVSDAARAANRRQTADVCREVLTDAVFEKVKQL
jgi:hypothetical protein